jgi:hypothetical protein
MAKVLQPQLLRAPNFNFLYIISSII